MSYLLPCYTHAAPSLRHECGAQRCGPYTYLDNTIIGKYHNKTSKCFVHQVTSTLICLRNAYIALLVLTWPASLKKQTAWKPSVDPNVFDAFLTPLKPNMKQIEGYAHRCRMLMCDITCTTNVLLRNCGNGYGRRAANFLMNYIRQQVCFKRFFLRIYFTSIKTRKAL